jgi:hypothetical protein
MVVYMYDFLDKPTTGDNRFDVVIGLLQYINVPKRDLWSYLVLKICDVNYMCRISSGV